MKKILAIVLALAMVMALGVTAFADDVKVAFSQIGQESDWRTANTDSIKSTIEGHEGWMTSVGTPLLSCWLQQLLCLQKGVPFLRG